MKNALLGAAALYLITCLLPFAAGYESLLDKVLPESDALESTSPGTEEELPSQSLSLPESYPVMNSYTGEILYLSPIEYIKGAVAAEMTLSCEDEALKAQAVACHSLALHRLGEELNQEEIAISTDPNNFQGYLSLESRKTLFGDGFDKAEARLEAIAQETAHIVLTYQGSPAEAAFFSLSSGRTESAKDVWGGEVPYLVPVDSSWDLQSADLTAEFSFSLSEAESLLCARLSRRQIGEAPQISVLSRSDSGMVLTALVYGQILSGTELREIFSLPSANFTVFSKDDAVIFTTTGKGHGVGMSQFGANMMAKEGKSFEEILSHYYPGTSLTTLS